MATVTLEPLTRDAAQSVMEGNRRLDWAAGYPTPGDLTVAAKIADGTNPPADHVRPWSVWVIRVDDLVVGGVGFHGEPDEAGSVEIGYGIAEEYRGQGVTTTAATLLLEMAAAAGASSAFATTDPGNAASQGVLRHCGFVRDGELHGEMLWTLASLPQSPA